MHAFCERVTSSNRLSVWCAMACTMPKSSTLTDVMATGAPISALFRLIDRHSPHSHRP